VPAQPPGTRRRWLLTRIDQQTATIHKMRGYLMKKLERVTPQFSELLKEIFKLIMACAIVLSQPL
jgi:hypothetical protein